MIAASWEQVTAMKFIPLKPKAQTTAQTTTGKAIAIHTDSSFDIVAIDQRGGDYIVAVYGDTSGLGEVVLNPADFEVPDALKITGQTLLKDAPKQSAALKANEKSPVAVGEFIVGELQPEKSGHYCIKVDGEAKYIFKGHAELATAIVLEAQQGDELINAAGLTIIKEFEGYRDKAYQCSANVWTIGWGTTVYPDRTKVQPGDTCNEPDAEEWLIQYVTERCKTALEKIPTWGQMNANQRAALYSFAYNLGEHFYGMHPDFTSMTKVCDSPDKWNDAAWIQEQFYKYRMPGSPSEPGLKRRRIAEAKLFCS